MTKYQLVGLAHPGWVDIRPYGRIALANISDDLAEELFKRGVPYIEVNPDHLAEVYETDITTSVVPKKKKTFRRS